MSFGALEMLELQDDGGAPSLFTNGASGASPEFADGNFLRITARGGVPASAIKMLYEMIGVVSLQFIQVKRKANWVRSAQADCPK